MKLIRFHVKGSIQQVAVHGNSCSTCVFSLLITNTSTTLCIKILKVRNVAHLLPGK